jgi:type II secretory pathway component GspD/PulD (secretin)/beta-lactamase regulating signal transducer with metallopeptidase domain
MSLVVLLAAWLQRLIKPSLWRRTIWQTALLGMVLLLAGELTGVNGVVAGWSHLRKIPAQISSPLPDLKTKAVVSVKILSTGLTQMPDAPELGAPLSGPAKSVSAVWWPAGIWLLGMLGAMTGVLAPRFLFWWLRRRRVQPVTDERLIQCVGTLARRMGIRRPVRMIKRPSLSGPVAFGWWRPTVGLPDSIDSHFTASQQEVMMAHELAHLAAHDPAWHFLADLVCALLWWHPLAWWSRGRLLCASEMAADEASRLMANGPGTLAECLVVMGRRLSQPVGFGWQRIEGNGFRSSLGQRVERLLAMPEHPWQPWGRTRQWLGILSGLITVVVLVVTGMAWLAPTSLAGDLATPKSWRQTWKSSLAAMALTAAISPADVMPVAEGNSSGGLTTPGDKMEELLSIRTYSVDEETLVPRMRKQSGASQATNELPQLFRNYLAQVVGLKTAPKMVAFNRNAGLLLIRARWIDYPIIERALDTLAGTETSRASTAPDRHTLDRMLEARTRDLANRVSTAPTNASQEPLFTRLFKVDPNTFLQGLMDSRNTMGFHPLDEPPGSQTAKSASTTVNVQLLARQFFEEMGVIFPQYGSGNSNVDPRKGAPPIPPSVWPAIISGNTNAESRKEAPVQASTAPVMFFNDRTGVLYVRATLLELDLIDQGIQFLTSSPAQVNVEAKFVEMSEEQAQALTGIIHPLPQLDQTGAAKPSLASTNRPPIRGIMTDRQYREFIRSMEIASGVDVLSAPRVTTLSGRQTQIQVQNTLQNVVMKPNPQVQGTPPKADGLINNRNSAPFALTIQELQTTSIPTGLCIDIIPRVLPDGNSIRMTVMASLTNFLGYGNPDISEAAIFEASLQAQQGTIRSPVPLPRFQVLQITTSAIVWDGQTIVLGGLISDDVRRQRDKVPVLGDIPMLGRLFRSEKNTTAKKNLVIFVTPTLIDPAGNRIHADDNLPFDSNTFPPQSGSQ